MCRSADVRWAAANASLDSAQYTSNMASLAIQRRSAFGWIIRRSIFSAPLDIFHVPTHLPRSWRHRICSARS